jgi:hypothetical protein
MKLTNAGADFSNSQGNINISTSGGEQLSISMNVNGSYVSMYMSREEIAELASLLQLFAEDKK